MAVGAEGRGEDGSEGREVLAVVAEGLEGQGRAGGAVQHRVVLALGREGRARRVGAARAGEGAVRVQALDDVAVGAARAFLPQQAGRVGARGEVERLEQVLGAAAERVLGRGVVVEERAPHARALGRERRRRRRQHGRRRRARRVGDGGRGLGRRRARGALNGADVDDAERAHLLFVRERPRRGRQVEVAVAAAPRRAEGEQAAEDDGHGDGQGDEQRQVVEHRRGRGKHERPKGTGAARDAGRARTDGAGTRGRRGKGRAGHGSAHVTAPGRRFAFPFREMTHRCTRTKVAPPPPPSNRARRRTRDGGCRCEARRRAASIKTLRT